MKSTFQKTVSAINEGRSDVATVGLIKLLANPLFFAWVVISLWLLTQIDFPLDSSITPRVALAILYIINGAACGLALLFRVIFMLMSLLDRWDQMDKEYQSYHPRKAKEEGYSWNTLEEYDLYSSEPPTITMKAAQIPNPYMDPVTALYDDFRFEFDDGEQEDTAFLESFLEDADDEAEQ